MKKHNILLTKTDGESSNWISISPCKVHSKSTKLIEVDSPEELSDSLLAEFNNTPTELLPEFKVKLVDWIKSSNSKNIDLSEKKEIRDFIYEMF
jgi:hypothetical protein